MFMGPYKANQNSLYFRYVRKLVVAILYTILIYITQHVQYVMSSQKGRAMCTF